MFQWCLSLAIALARKDVEVHLHAPQTKTEHFWLYVCVCVREVCVWVGVRIVILKNCVIVRKQHLDRRIQLVTCPHSHWQ